jgi:hypothetical protein
LKKRTLKRICDYWEREARRCEQDAAFWQQQLLEATRRLEELRADPLAAFRDEFRAEADRRIDAWLSDDADQDRLP